MNAQDLRNKFASQEAEILKKEFISFYTTTSKKAHVSMNGLIYPFRIVGHTGSGCGVFIPIDKTCAKYLREAPEDTRKKLIKLMPTLTFITCFENEQGLVSYPFSIKEAEKMDLAGEVAIKGAPPLERFAIINTRFDGVHFWFDSISQISRKKYDDIRLCTKTHYTPKQMMSEFNLLETTPEDKKAFALFLSAWAIFKHQNTEYKVKQFIASCGATVGSYVLKENNIEVKWISKNGTIFSSNMNTKELDSISAGITVEKDKITLLPNLHDPEDRLMRKRIF